MKTYPALWLVMAILACAALSMITPASQPVRAAGPWYVAPGGSDNSTCTAPSAPCATINAALNKPGFVTGDTIRVATGVYTGAGDQVVLLDKNVTLSGGWNAGFAAQGGAATIDGDGVRRGMVVNSEVIAIIEHLTVRNCSSSEGGGIHNAGILTLNNSIVSGNRGDQGGGISNRGTLALNNSTVNGNTATMQGGGIFNVGILTLNGSTVGNNIHIASSDGGGGVWNFGVLTSNNSTMSGNMTGGVGGGILSQQGVLTLNNSTISDNTATNFGGIYNYDASSITLQSTILAGNAVSDLGGLGHSNSAGYNIIGNTSGTFNPISSDLTNVDPKLGPLEGSPGYHPLSLDSPAVNGGNPAGCTDDKGNPLSADQRGLPRVGRCDIGAYELQPIGFSALTVNRSAAFRGDPLTYTIAFHNVGATEITNVQVTDILPASLSYINNSLTATSGSFGYQNGVITWTGTVNAGGAVTITYGATVNPTLGFIVNSAVISGGGDSITRTATVTVDGPICNLTKHGGSPVLALGAGGSWDDGAVWGPVVLKERNTYKMWYTGSDGFDPSRIGLATSTDGTTWTKAAAHPVFSPSMGWETKGIRAGSVISENGLYKMWYTGRDNNGMNLIGYATSPDGVAWTEYGPVLLNGIPPFGWDDEGVSEPTVIKEDLTYHLWYTGNDGVTLRIGHATSFDGIRWTKDRVNPVLDIGSPGAWDWLNIYDPSVVKVGAEYKLWYSGETLPAAWQTGYAMSSDGSTWTRGKMLIPEGSSGAFDAASADYPSVMVEGDKFKVWYSGLNNSGDYTIGYATAEICRGASVPPGRPIYLPLVVKNSGQSCPAYYTDNFSDPASGWLVDDDSNRKYAYTEGQYQIWVKNPDEGWWVTPGAKATDFTASVSARRTSGAWGAYGIRFGITEVPGSQFYEFIVENTHYSIWKYDGENWTALRDWTASGDISTGTNWNRLKVIRNGASIAVYVNDQLLATVSDSNFTGLRRIGLVAYSPDDSGLDARFDDFSLYPASCGPSAAGVGFEMGEPGAYEAPLPPGLGQLP